MTLRHLEILRAVAHTGSFTRAAESLYLTQSAVSHAIRELEDRAGTTLVDRLSKRAQLTSAGQRLLEQAEPILSAMTALDAGLEDLEKQAPIRLVTSITIGAYWLPGILKAFAAQWPQVQVLVEVVSAANALAVLRSGQADLALVEGSAPVGPFRWEVFSAYAMCAVCAPQYAQASGVWSLGALCGQRLLLREAGSAIRDALDSAFCLAGLIARPVWVSVNTPALIEAAKAGLGITVLPELLVRRELERGELTRMATPELKLHNALLAVWHRDKHWSRPLRALYEEITRQHSP